MWGRSGQKCPVGAKFPPFGGAGTPGPQGGERSSMQRKKTAIITARMTPGIKDLIQHQAKQAGMTVTDYIITCALGKEIVRVDGLDEILAEVKAQGRNLDETFLKENLETLFAYRQAVGFRPNTPEPEEGWMGELASELVRLGRSIEEADDLPPLPAPPVWTESKQRHREALKKLALGQKLSRGQNWQQTMW